jgi:hypothetical protein
LPKVSPGTSQYTQRQLQALFGLSSIPTDTPPVRRDATA